MPNIVRTLVLLMAMAPAKQFLNLGGAKPPGYTHVVTSPPGKMVFISGQGGAAADGTMPPDFSAQAKNTFENIRRCLELAGANFNDVVKITYYVTSMENPPAATLVQAGLGSGLLLEVEAIAIVP